jgi:hypothetical protein
MGKIIAALAFAAIVTPAWGDAVETIDGKSAVEFVLSTCLPAMDDVANLETMARENNWFPLPRVPSNSPHVTQRLRWRVNGFFVATWVWDEKLPSCFVGLGPFKKVDRNDFFDAISSSLKLKPISDKMLQQRLRQETYEIIGERPRKLLFSSTDDGTVSGASIYMDSQNEQPH